MKLLYFGTVCNRAAFEERQKSSRVKASTAPLNFESALLEGFAACGAELEIYSFPMIAAWPNSHLGAWGSRRETVAGGYCCTWLPALNLKGFKQFSQRISVKRALKQIRRNRVDGVLMYSVYAPVAAPVLKACKKHGISCWCIIADLPRDMYENRKMGRVKKLLSRIYTGRAVGLQGSFDGYVYLTEAMADVVAPKAPYVVVEGIADEMLLEFPKGERRSHAVMYAGALNEKYGISTLIDAFRKVDAPDWELWIFGDGDLNDTIRKIAEQESRLRFFGRVDRAEVLRRESEAALLVNPRPVGEAYTKYSFPSKTIEYMLSGTPLLTTRLAGIPEVYFDHVYTAADGTEEALKAAFQYIFSLSDGERGKKAASARAFVQNRAASAAQAGRILEFIRSASQR